MAAIRTHPAQRVGIRTRTALPRAARGARRRVAVSLHDIEPATFERSALIRDWLNDHGVDRVTLLVIPARDLHPSCEWVLGHAGHRRQAITYDELLAGS